MERRVFRNYYKGHMDKAKGEVGSKGGRWVSMGYGGRVGRKCRQLYLTTIKELLKKKKESVGNKLGLYLE